MSGAGWYYLSADGQNVGPYDEKAFTGGLNALHLCTSTSEYLCRTSDFRVSSVDAQDQKSFTFRSLYRLGGEGVSKRSDPRLENRPGRMATSQGRARALEARSHISGRTF